MAILKAALMLVGLISFAPFEERSGCPYATVASMPPAGIWTTRLLKVSAIKIVASAANFTSDGALRARGDAFGDAPVFAVIVVRLACPNAFVAVMPDVNGALNIKTRFSAGSAT